MAQNCTQVEYMPMESFLTNKERVCSLRSSHGNDCLLYIPILLLKPPKNAIGYWFLQTIIFMRKYLLKYSIAYFFSSLSTIKIISAIYVILLH